ncbi:MAG: atpH [Candidatus Saccharibacteria bacterium]|nr:atpH [Candidatus Saccharibacteria bacterium]
MARKLSRRSLALYVADQILTDNARTVVKQLAAYLVENRRTKELELIVRDVDYFLSQRGIITATITSAFDLSVETKKAITAFITNKTKASSVIVGTTIDPSVIGGVKINLPGYEFDQTVAHQLTVLKTRFKKA